jgi:hypothetical protein
VGPALTALVSAAAALAEATKPSEHKAALLEPPVLQVPR